jgi:hypothetical protein
MREDIARFAKYATSQLHNDLNGKHCLAWWKRYLDDGSAKIQFEPAVRKWRQIQAMYLIMSKVLRENND